MSPADGQRRDVFPAGFLWGVSTAAYQVEGAPAEDGKGRSIWDAFSHQPGRTVHGDTGDIACDDYHRVDEDIALVSRLNAGAYRFSISWPRIQPEPLINGSYPARLGPDYAPGPRLVQDGDFGTIQAPIDFLGVNYYAPHIVGVRENGIFRRGDTPMGRGDAAFVRPDGMPVTTMDWLVHPDGLYELLIRLRNDAPGLPVYITENGAACDDYVNPDGTVEDTERIAYLQGHLRAAHRAVTAGADLRGYFAWSLLDNFEWAHGYSKRFGLVFTEYGTQRRIPKRSAGWFAEVARTDSIPAE